MKSPSEIAMDTVSGIAWKLPTDAICPTDRIFTCYYGQIEEAITKIITTERQRQERLIELVDGCTPVIESWAVISVAQAEWKKRWLSEAKQVLKENQ